MLNILNKKSGVLGLSEVSSDFRDLNEAAENGNEQAKTTLEAYSYRVAKYIGSYVAAMNGVDAIVFTAGVGENNHVVREAICENMQYLGLEIDKEKNKLRGLDVNDITGPNSKVKVLVVATNEELMIARDTKKVVFGE